MLDDKISKIIDYLFNNQRYYTSDELALALQMNSRTIRLYLSELKNLALKNGFEIISSPNLGYFLDTSRIQSLKF